MSKKKIKKSRPDQVEKLLEAFPDVFADIVNILVFGGEEVIVPKNLVTGSTSGIYKAAEGYLNQKNRDVLRYDMEKNAAIAVYGLENQTKVSNVMPNRVMGYDFAVYDRNISELKEKNRADGIAIDFVKEIGPGQKICPVVTLVLYFGTMPWTGPRNLYESDRNCILGGRDN